MISNAGDTPQAITIVMAGRVTLTREGRSELVIERGGGFGLLTVMAESVSARAVAIAETVVLEIPAAAFRAALEENFSLLRQALRTMSASLFAARGRLPADPTKPLNPELGEFFEKPRSLVENLLALRKGAFVDMDIDALVDLTRRMVEVRVPAGHVFWAAGEPATYALHVEYGRVRCTVPEGPHVDVGHDYTIGVMDVWSGESRGYEARAETQTIAYQIEYEDFLAVTELHVSVGLDMLREMTREYLAHEKNAGS